MRRDLAKLEEWARIWQLRFNAKICRAMHLGCKNPRERYSIGGEVLLSMKEEGDLGAILYDDLIVAKQAEVEE